MLLKLLKRKKGWSLFETVITLVLFSLLGLLASTVFIAGETMVEVNDSKLSLQQEARLGMTRVLKELRQAQPSSISLSQNNTSITFAIPQSIDPNSGAITWSLPITYSVGGINSAQLIRSQTGSTDTTILANHMNTNLADPNRLQFQLDQSPNPTQVTITMGMQQTILKGQTITADLTGEVNIRNLP